MELPFPDAPPNFLAIYAQGRQIGEAQRMQHDRQNALAMIGTNPEGAKAALLGVGDIPSAVAVDRLGEQQTRKRVLGQYGTDPTAARQGALESGDADLINAVSSLDAQDRALANERAQRLAAVAFKLKQSPYEQRKAALQSLGPSLQGAFGFTPEQLGSFDPTDANLDAVIGQGAKLSELITSTDKNADNTRQQSQLDELIRHNRAMEEAAMGRVDVARSRERRQGAGGGAQPQGVPPGFVLE